MNSLVENSNSPQGVARRIYIPKPGNTENRALTIASPREKVRKPWNWYSIYEPMFLPTSRGFRPKMSTHSALSMIDVQFKGLVYPSRPNVLIPSISAN